MRPFQSPDPATLSPPARLRPPRGPKPVADHDSARPRPAGVSVKKLRSCDGLQSRHAQDAWLACPCFGCRPGAPTLYRSWQRPALPPSLCAGRLFPPWKGQLFQLWLRSPLERSLIFCPYLFRHPLEPSRDFVVRPAHGRHAASPIAGSRAARHSPVSRRDPGPLLLPGPRSLTSNRRLLPPLAKGSGSRHLSPPMPPALPSGSTHRVEPFSLPPLSPFQSCARRMAGMCSSALPKRHPAVIYAPSLRRRPYPPPSALRIATPDLRPISSLGKGPKRQMAYPPPSSICHHFQAPLLSGAFFFPPSVRICKTCMAALPRRRLLTALHPRIKVPSDCAASPPAAASQWPEPSGASQKASPIPSGEAFAFSRHAEPSPSPVEWGG